MWHWLGFSNCLCVQDSICDFSENQWFWLLSGIQTPPSYGFGRYGFGFFGPRIAFPATGALWGRATPFFPPFFFSVHLSSVLGQTELCHEVWTPGPPKPQIISNENHHLALLSGFGRVSILEGTSELIWKRFCWRWYSLACLEECMGTFVSSMVSPQRPSRFQQRAFRQLGLRKLRTSTTLSIF